VVLERVVFDPFQRDESHNALNTAVAKRLLSNSTSNEELNESNGGYLAAVFHRWNVLPPHCNRRAVRRHFYDVDRVAQFLSVDPKHNANELYSRFSTQ